MAPHPVPGIPAEGREIGPAGPERARGRRAISAHAERSGAGRPPLVVAALGAWRLLLLALWLVALAGALVFLDRSLGHFWQQFGPIYRSTALQNRLDFSWFYYGMQTAWLHSDPLHRLYDVAAQDRWMQTHGFSYDHTDMYGYPPMFALIWSPLAALPYTVARAVWSNLNLFAFGLGLAVAAWHASPRFSLARWLFLASFGLWTPVVQNSFYWGQPDTMILALVALGLWAICRPNPGRWAPVLGGVAIGLATCFKVTPAVILVYLALRWLVVRDGPRGRAAGLGALAGWGTVAVLAAWSGALLGWGLLPKYVLDVLPAVERSAWAHGAAPWNQSFRGILMIWHHNVTKLNHWADLFGAGVVLLVLGVVALRPKLDHRLEAAALALLVLLASPSLENHHFSVMMLPWILLGGYLLDRLVEWRRLWPWPAAGLFALASFAAVSPAKLPTLHLPTTAGVTTAVPAGRYQRVYLVGASTWGPVAFTLGLTYQGAPAGRVAAVWPDWFEPGNPLTPVVPAEAEKGGQPNHVVGLYGFSYAVRPTATLDGLRFPTTLPPKTGGDPGLHVVAITLETAGAAPRYVQVPLGFNAKGIASNPRQVVPTARSFDGAGNILWTAHWASGLVQIQVGASKVPFRMPSAAAPLNVYNVPQTPPAPPGLAGVLATRAPNFVATALLMIIALAAAVAEFLGALRKPVAPQAS